MGDSTMVLDSARPRLKTLATVAARLNEAAERFAAELATIEAELDALHIGLELSMYQPFRVSETVLDDSGDEEVRYQTLYYLGYHRIHDRWRVAVLTHRQEVGTEGLPGDITYVGATPLASASRDLQIAAAGQIPPLLKLLQEEAQAHVDKLEKVSARHNA